MKTSFNFLDGNDSTKIKYLNIVKRLSISREIWLPNGYTHTRVLSTHQYDMDVLSTQKWEMGLLSTRQWEMCVLSYNKVMALMLTLLTRH